MTAPSRSAPADRAATGVAPEPAAVARAALRRVASGVTVLTVWGPDRLPHGTTVSAVMPISRIPLVLGACLRSSSTFTGMAEQVGAFSVNVLADEQIALASRFADPGRPRGPDQFLDLRWTRDETTGAPLLPGCIAHLSCRVTDLHRIGDHDLLVAEVAAGTAATGTPLLSFAGRLRIDRPERPTRPEGASLRD